jgi:hypothetical protein
MGFSLMEIFKNHPTLNAAEIFLHLYENVACTICRDVFIERLIEIDKLPDWLREECKYDANEEVRKLVAAGG